ncbi:MAG: TRAP transporter large permease [Burkholderiaceae bacterium]|nr:TRAP transporter large permease [Burkholderiaceae bacterium]
MSAALLGLVGLFALIFARVPIAVSLAVVGFVGFSFEVGVEPALALVAHATKEGTLNFELSVVPLFVLMGNLIARARLSDELYAAAYAFLGHLKGGLALATIAACGGFSAVCGSSMATAATMAKVSMPSMRRYNYDDRLATGAIAAGGTLGILIPPSVMLLIYGLVTETHIGKLFAAGVIPGLIGVLGYMAAVRYTTWRDPDQGPPGERTDWPGRWRALRGVWGVVVLFALVMGGIYAGWFTPTEAAAIGAAGGFIFALLRRALSFKSLLDVLVETTRTSAKIFAVLIGALIFSEFVNYTGVHKGFVEWVTGLGVSSWVIVLVMVGVYLVLGCVLESLSMILLTVPLFFPIITELGYDPVWFGIVVVVAMEIGLITPPIGVNVFVLRSVQPDVSMATIFRGVMPFFFADVGRILLLALVPVLSTWLPNLLF